ncbi:delta(14)-sterol reductase TM7SF2-like [Ammospiza caudacuta]|uniref:delta(14)-sterol reductase TM7SF2-like n=1 Tax=Ammospiza caudacuta TaxID=2857398 RepID=UPI0027389C98|nr:delta(14)-sterol reductase TM7SF2-like [Ammospiza caudacuta]
MEPPRVAPPPPELEFGGPWGTGALSLLLPLGLVGVVSATVGEGRGGAWGAPSPPLAAPTPPALALVLAAPVTPQDPSGTSAELSVNPAPGPGGFLGLFGGLAWGPFGAPLPVLLLLRRPQQGLGGAGGAACGGLYALGLWIFHGATTQRSLFSRDPRDPRVAGLATVPTATGQLLLAGGWWGLVRRPDDLGELLMALGWTLPCGLSPPLLLLLAGAALRELRALQGERRQRRRFGGAWGGLCQRVPHRLLPLLY